MKSNKKWMVQSLLRMAEITDDEIKRSEYLEEVEDLMLEIQQQEIKIKDLKNDSRRYRYESVIKFLEFLDENNLKVIGKSSSQMYLDYVDFCEMKELRKVSNIVFGKEIRKRLDVQTRVKNIDGKSQRFYEKSEYY